MRGSKERVQYSPLYLFLYVNDFEVLLEAVGYAKEYAESNVLGHRVLWKYYGGSI
jgi:hypothetical protein